MSWFETGFKKSGQAQTNTYWSFGGDVVSEPLKTALESGFFKKYDTPRAKGLHPSQIHGMCFREKIYSEYLLDVMSECPEISNIEFKEDITATLQAKFDIGHAIHHWYQNKYLGPMGILKGGWACKKCDAYQEGFMPANVCSCGGRWRFIEPQANIPELDIVGHCDGIIDRGDGPWVMDIKTIDPDRFRSLSEPSMSYIYQVHCYMMALQINRAIILYVDKSSNMGNPTKEIKITLDPDIEKDVIRIANEYKSMKKDKALAERTCKTKGCTKAKRCAFSSICFDDTITTLFEQEWKKNG